MTLQGNANRDGHQLELVPGSWRVQRIFDITGMGRPFAWRATIEPTADDGVTNLTPVAGGVSERAPPPSKRFLRTLSAP